MFVVIFSGYMEGAIAPRPEDSRLSIVGYYDRIIRVRACDIREKC